MKKYDIFMLNRDLNPVIRKGMQGVILSIANPQKIEAEFLQDDGTDYEYQGNITFPVDADDITILTKGSH